MISVENIHLNVIAKNVWNWRACGMNFYDVKTKGVNIRFRRIIDIVRSSFEGRRSAFVSTTELASAKQSDDVY